MNGDFAVYLEAKYPLDSRSLNQDTLETLKATIHPMKQVRCLDLGTGTGAMLKRVIEMDLMASFDITGLDIDPSLLAIAAKKLTECLHKNGFRTEKSETGICAHRNQQTIRIHFECASILNWKHNAAYPRFDLVTAHAFMDILPLKPVIDKVRTFLKPSGLFYSTLNYDGNTTLFPDYSNRNFEEKILKHYDRSMECRRINGQSTGGAYSGRRLINLLSAMEFTINSYGSSDWNITPLNGQYRDDDATCLESLLTMIYGEAYKSDNFEPDSLSNWYTNRLQTISADTLGMIVHQLDILATAPHQ